MPFDDDFDLDEPEGEVAGKAGWVVPVLTVTAALAVGLVAGGVMSFLVFGRERTVIEVARDLSNEEIDALCTPFVDEAVVQAADDLTEAQSRVSTLQDDVFAKEREVADLEAEMTRRATRGRALVEELDAARAELTTLKSQLETAVAEKEELFQELRHTEQQLEQQVAQTTVAREDALSFKWTAFVGAAQLDICERGGRRKMGRCREVVEEILPTFRDRFEHCVRSGQEIPALVEAARDMVELPMYGEWLDNENRVTSGWYVLLCDPTLPEAEGSAGAPVRAPPANPSGTFNFEDLDD